jgi:hypothetical protein
VMLLEGVLIGLGCFILGQILARLSARRRPGTDRGVDESMAEFEVRAQQDETSGYRRFKQETPGWNRGIAP